MTHEKCYRILISLGYSSKKASPSLGMNDAATEKKRQKDLKALRAELPGEEAIDNIVFVDESSITIGELKTELGLISKRGCNAFASDMAYDPYANTRLTALVFISASGEQEVTECRDNVNAEIFEDLLLRFLDNCPLKNIYLLLDNARVHSKAVLDALIQA